ncbi:MAG: cytochrome c oxidase subunit 3 [Anaerolineae bacterium]|jgi:heme/copper-type cytochrome/quinol oxidase subunit 3|nr:cytochrome c oxidase subunit 3 [Anaerolineae bacterium]
MQRDLLELGLTRQEQQALQNKRAGIFIFQASWILTFVCLIVVNWQMRFSPNWMPDPNDRLGVVIATIATAILGASALLVRHAVKVVNNQNLSEFLRLWLISILLGGIFVVLIGYEWVIVPTGTQYAQVFRVMTGFHIVHAVSIGIYLGLVYVNGRKRVYNVNDYLWAVEAGAKLWYFVLVAWLLFYVVIYWI